MAIRINLLPDSKQARLKAQRTRHLIISIATAVTIIAIAVPVILLAVKGGQSLYLKNTQQQIDEKKQTLKSTPDITTILSVKDHLDALPSLYQQRLLVTKLLAYLPKVTPKDIRLTNITVDIAATRMIITGSTTNYGSVDKFYKALQRARVAFDANKVEPDPDTTGYFSGVVLEDVSGPAGSEVSFTITTNFTSELITGAGN